MLNARKKQILQIQEKKMIAEQTIFSQQSNTQMFDEQNNMVIDGDVFPTTTSTSSRTESEKESPKIQSSRSPKAIAAKQEMQNLREVAKKEKRHNVATKKWRNNHKLSMTRPTELQNKHARIGEMSSVEVDYYTEMPREMFMMPPKAFRKEIKTLQNAGTTIKLPEETLETLQTAFEGYITDIFRNAEACREKRNERYTRDIMSITRENFRSVVFSMTGVYPQLLDTSAVCEESSTVNMHL